MIPLRDNIPPRRFPFVNYAILGFTTLVFVSQLLESHRGDRLVERFGMVPARVLDPDGKITVTQRRAVDTPFGIRVVERRIEVPPAALPPWLTLLTCIFLHAGWLHFLGNMWTLYIFGDNVEDRLGHLGYLAFYLLTGVAASAAHLAANTDSPVPTIGASGAIAGVMGAYMRLYPRAKVLTLVPVLVFLHMVVLPAPFFLGLWFLLQLFQGTISMGATEMGGVAWWAHIGGFAVGYLIASILGGRGVLHPQVEVIRPNTERIRVYRVRPWEGHRR